VVTALYRRYRPETFAELIGQAQVTDPLRTALRNDRVNHAYLFSGPRGCGKTTSARILARCLNCVEGPTDTPCGVCPSCVELSRDGGGSMDVVEIDAASHNGVDDARDIRERAIFAPARDRYKIFILDEAHMVTSQGFNALLKIVEEPPEHVKFIFATTEPEKVIGTIRSRTHHYPFRLVPPAQMLEYVQQLCESEQVTVEGGVLPLVVRAGGGSVRDTLSLLDQLIAGSEGASVQYERAVALLGYTHAALLNEVIEAIGSRDAAAAFASVDRVIQTGQDPRRFVEDLLERLRDLIVVAAFSHGSGAEGAAAVLRGIQQEELELMGAQAAHFGTAELSRAADVVNAALTEMTGATSPRLHLELMVARILVPASDETERGALARVERLERRIGVETAGLPTPAASSAPAASSPPAAQSIPASPMAAQPTPPERIASTPAPTETAPATEAPRDPKTVTLQHVKDAWPEILEAVKKSKLSAWMVVFTAKPLELRADGVLTLSFPSENDVIAIKQRAAPGEGTADILKQAIFDVLGIRPGFIAKVDAARPAAVPEPQDAAPAAPARATRPDAATSASDAAQAPADDTPPEPTEPEIEPGAPSGATWETAVVTDSEPETKPTSAQVKVKVPAAKTEAATPKLVAPTIAAPGKATMRPPTAPASRPGDKQRYGEAVVREILNASFIEEQVVVPRVSPREL
jgi:DNA polymerase-3 subunit gamma/tau